MGKYIAFFVTLVLALLTVACSSTPTIALAPTPEPFSLPTLFPSTPIPPTATALPTATLAPTALPPTETAAPASAADVTPTAPATVAAVPTPTLAPTAAPTPTLAVPAGLWVTGMRTEPDPPLRGADLRFFVNFANTLPNDQNYRWDVYIYKADTPNKLFGETSKTDSPIPVGTGERESVGFWRLPLGGPCDFFFARVVWFNGDNKAVPFTTPDGKVFEKGLTICPP